MFAYARITCAQDACQPLEGMMDIQHVERVPVDRIASDEESSCVGSLERYCATKVVRWSLTLTEYVVARRKSLPRLMFNSYEP